MHINNIKNLGVTTGVIREQTSGLTYLLPIFKEILAYLHVPNVDLCCPYDFNPKPLGYDVINNNIQYYDYYSNTWINTVNNTLIGQRFGIEDNVGIQDRLMNLGIYELDIVAGTPDYTGQTSEIFIDASTAELHHVNPTGNADAYVGVGDVNAYIQFAAAGNSSTVEVSVDTVSLLKTNGTLTTQLQVFNNVIKAQYGTGILTPMVLSVNGIYADNNGNVTISTGTGTGGGPVRFGIEDNVGIQDRLMDMDGFNFFITNCYSFGLYQRDESGTQIQAGIDSSADYTNPYVRHFAKDLNSVNEIGLVTYPTSVRVEPSVGNIYGGGLTGIIYVPLSVNGVQADATGNITISTGGGGGGGLTRFGIEDNTGIQNRLMNLGNFELDITSGTANYSGQTSEIFIDPSKVELYHQNPNNTTSSYVGVGDVSSYLQFVSSTNSSTVDVSIDTVSLIKTNGTVTSTLSVYNNVVKAQYGTGILTPVVLSVNNVYADLAGNVNLSLGTGGGALHFGIEDNVGIQNRLMNLGTFELDITSGTADYSAQTSEFYINPTKVELYHQNASTTDSSYVGVNDTSAYMEFISGLNTATITNDLVSISLIKANASVNTELTIFDNVVQARYGTGILTPVVLSVNGNYADLTGNVDVISQLPGNSLTQVSDGLYVSSPTPNQRSYGGLVTWIANYDYHVTSAGYNLNGVSYVSPAADFTLASADPTLDRIDAFIVDSTGVASVLTGVASSNPIPPAITLGSQLLLSLVLVQAATTAPSINQECIYLENTEWATSVNDASLNPNSLNTPCQGVKSIEGIAVANNATVSFLRSASFIPTTSFTSLSFLLKSRGSWGKNKKIGLQWFNGSTPYGTELIVKNGPLFDSSNVTACQTITFDLALFGIPTNISVNTLKIRAINPSGAYGFFIDRICLQNNVISPNPTGSTYELNLTTIGTSGAATYNPTTDTLNIPIYGGGGGSTYTADNGLTASTATNFQLGGALLHETIIDAGTLYKLNIINNSNSVGTQIVNAGAGSALFSWAQGGGTGVVGQGGGIGVQGISDGLFGAVSGQTQNGVAFYANILGANNNAIQTAIKIARQSPSAAIAGIGASIEFVINTDTSFAQSNEIVSKWTNAVDATRTSQFYITGINNGGIKNTLLSLNGDGKAILNKYGTGTFTGTTTYLLGVDASGNVIETTAGGGGGADVLLITVTKSAADTLISTSSLQPGQNYKITNVDPTLYGGTDVILRAFSTTEFELAGHGIFYNPKYNQALADQGIWNTYSTFTATVTAGRFTQGETITANTGGTGTLLGNISNGLFTITGGTWTGAVSVTGASSGATATITALVIKTYAIGSTVIWGGKHWTNVNGNLGASLNYRNLNTEWAVVPYDTTNYNVRIDPIHYDYANDYIIERRDKNDNTVRSSANTIATWNGVSRTIGLFQWGNPYVESTLKGTGNNSIIEGYADCINYIGCFAYNIVNDRSYFDANTTYSAVIRRNKLYGGSTISGNKIIKSAIHGNTLDKGSSDNAVAGNACGMNNNVLSADSFIKDNVLSVSSFMNSNTLDYNSYIYINELISSNMNSNTLVYSLIYTNRLFSACNINSNTFFAIVTAYGAIFNNNLQFSSSINSNAVSAGTIRLNTLNYNSNISSNSLQLYTAIWGNKLQAAGFINSNTLTSGTNVNFSFIFNNDIYGSKINSNTITNCASILSNTMTKTTGFDPVAGTINGNSEITGVTVTGSGTNISSSAVSGCKIDSAILKNVSMSGGTTIRNFNIRSFTYDLGSVTIGTNMDDCTLNPSQEFIRTTVTFTGAAGSGAVGAVTIPPYQIPTGFFIEEVFINTNITLVAADGTSNITLGVATDAPTSGLNSTTGLVTTLNTNVTTRVVASAFTKATTTRNLVINVGGSAINSGAISLIIRLSKFQ